MSASFDAEAPRSSGQSAGLLSALRRHPVVMILSVILFGALGVGATLVLPTNYSAQAKVILGDQNDLRQFKSVPSLNATAKAQNAAQIMRSDPVYTRASELLDNELSPNAVKQAVTVAPGAEGNPLVTITASQHSGARARDVANAEAQAYLDISQTQNAQRSTKTAQTLKDSQDTLQTQLTAVTAKVAARAKTVTATGSAITDAAARLRFVQNALDDDSEYGALQSQATALRTSINQIKEKLQETAIDSALVAQGVDTVYKATKPSDPRAGDLKRNVAIALALGLLVGAALAWRRLDRERTVVDHDQVSAILDAPMLAKMSRTKDLTLARGVADLSIGRRFGDDMRVLASGVLLDMRRRGLAATVITSAAPGEGKSVLALNLAAAARGAGFDVVLVDGDVRSAGLTRRYGLEDAPGLLDLLGGSRVVADLQNAAVVPDTELPVIPVGGRHLTASPRVAFPGLHREDGTSPGVIVDAPTLFEDPATLTLAEGVAGLVIVVSRATTIEDLRTLRARIDLVGAPITGYIVNDFRPTRRAKGKHAHDRRTAARKPARAREQRPELDEDDVLEPNGPEATTQPALDLFDEPARGADHPLFDEPHGADRADQAHTSDQVDVFDQAQSDGSTDSVAAYEPSDGTGDEHASEPWASPDVPDASDGTTPDDTVVDDTSVDDTVVDDTSVDDTVVDGTAPDGGAPDEPHTSAGTDTQDGTDEALTDVADAGAADGQPASTRSAERAAARNGKRGGTRQAARRRGVRAK